LLQTSSDNSSMLFVESCTGSIGNGLPVFLG
jgi:transketolase N-terminal domain/subunit